MRSAVCDGASSAFRSRAIRSPGPRHLARRARPAQASPAACDPGTPPLDSHSAGGDHPPMAIRLDHTIVSARDKEVSPRSLSEMVGVAAPGHARPFAMVQVDEASFDYVDSDEEIRSQHYAFLVSESEFDEIFGRIRARGLTYWADP